MHESIVLAITRAMKKKNSFRDISVDEFEKAENTFHRLIQKVYFSEGQI